MLDCESVCQCVCVCVVVISLFVLSVCVLVCLSTFLSVLDVMHDTSHTDAQISSRHIHNISARPNCLTAKIIASDRALQWRVQKRASMAGCKDGSEEVAPKRSFACTSSMTLQYPAVPL